MSLLAVGVWSLGVVQVIILTTLGHRCGQLNDDSSEERPLWAVIGMAAGVAVAQWTAITLL